MKQPNFDPGLTQKYERGLKRAINSDGRFNIRRIGANWHDAHPYLYLKTRLLGKFLLIVGSAFIVANTLFALGYFAIRILEQDYEARKHRRRLCAS